MKKPVRRGSVVGAVAVVALAVLTGCGVGTSGSASASSEVPVAPSSSVGAESPAGDGRSQTAADALRDRVLPQIAALSLAQRLTPTFSSNQPKEVTTADGLWVISSPSLEAAQGVVGGEAGECWGPDRSSGVDYQACPGGYSEALLLSRDRSRIVRAFPMPFPAYWILAGGTGVYFGRAGDGALPDSHVCRIDTGAWSLTCRVAVNTDDTDQYLADPEAFATLSAWPGTWTAYPRNVTVSLFEARLTESALVVSDQYGRQPTRLDPRSLLPSGATPSSSG